MIYSTILNFIIFANFSAFCDLTQYSKIQIFVQKFNFYEFLTQIFFDNFSRKIKVVNS